MKRKKDIFDDMGNAAIGLGTVGLATGVGASVASKVGMPGLSSGFNTIAGFGGIAVTGYMGKSVLKSLKKLK